MNRRRLTAGIVGAVAGKQIDLADFAGRVVLVNVRASWLEEALRQANRG